MMKKVIAPALFSLAFIMPLGTAANTASAKTTYLPRSIRSHVFYRTTDGTQGGYHDKTIFKGNRMTVKSYGHYYHWNLTGLKRHSKTIYYGRLHYSKKSSQLIKIKIYSSKHFDFIPKHTYGLTGNYKGTEDFGAIIFKR
ncbi:hypothetical protein [Secundilactobacillus folii]|uniref:Uncharacterized protein n=1 Tax=Secundilactobacillus folii TaxID=2678357 RepID=A0A7X2XTQ0_9LACO|nr:hypothetical protein [Secundilactobacillus folii]MTV81469.1 hypothetical protein [Secundilactobacillus folii]